MAEHHNVPPVARQLRALQLRGSHIGLECLPDASTRARGDGGRPARLESVLGSRTQSGLQPTHADRPVLQRLHDIARSRPPSQFESQQHTTRGSSTLIERQHGFDDVARRQHRTESGHCLIGSQLPRNAVHVHKVLKWIFEDRCPYSYSSDRSCRPQRRRARSRTCDRGQEAQRNHRRSMASLV